MSASGKSTGLHAFCRKFLPFMLRRCPGNNLHWRWDSLCICCSGTNGMGILIRMDGIWLDHELRPVQVPWWNVARPSAGEQP